MHCNVNIEEKNILYNTYKNRKTLYQNQKYAFLLGTNIKTGNKSSIFKFTNNILCDKENLITNIFKFIKPLRFNIIFQ
jgi:hypothetical protein